VPKTDPLEEHEDDQFKADAYKIIDESEELIVVGVGKDGTITRVRSVSDSGCVTMMGALLYQIHRLKLHLDYMHDGPDDEPSEVD